VSGRGLLYDGVRAALAEGDWTRWLVPAEGPRDLEVPAFRRAHFERYAGRIHERSPVVQMLAATVTRAVDHGVPTVVLVNPIPVARLRREGLYDEDGFANRIGVLKRVTEAAGGRLIDLHARLGPREFNDELGDTTPNGARQVAGALESEIRGGLP
jgi:hypothetical protein